MLNKSHRRLLNRKFSFLGCPDSIGKTIFNLYFLHYSFCLQKEIFCQYLLLVPSTFIINQQIFSVCLLRARTQEKKHKPMSHLGAHLFRARLRFFCTENLQNSFKAAFDKPFHTLELVLMFKNKTNKYYN